MGKLMLFVMFSLALSALLFLSGVTSDSETTTINVIRSLTLGHNDTNSSLLTSPVSPNVGNSILGLWIVIALGVAVAAGTAAVLFGNAGFAKVLASWGLAMILINFINDMIYVISKVGESCAIGVVCFEWVYWIVWFIFILIAGGYLWSLVDFVIGND